MVSIHFTKAKLLITKKILDNVATIDPSIFLLNFKNTFKYHTKQNDKENRRDSLRSVRFRTKNKNYYRSYFSFKNAFRKED